MPVEMDSFRRQITAAGDYARDDSKKFAGTKAAPNSK
jgi:hypothetical protein